MKTPPSKRHRLAASADKFTVTHGRLFIRTREQRIWLNLPYGNLGYRSGDVYVLPLTISFDA